MLRAVIYVDGQNLHYKLANLGLLEKDVHWGRVFDDLVPQDPPHRLVRAYWYQAARIAPWTWNPKYHARFCPEGMPLEEFERHARDYYRRERDRLERLHQQVYARIEENHPSVEFRYAGVLKVNPVRCRRDAAGELQVGQRVGEKGVDVAMAVDMVRQVDGYDLAIVVSGDYDFLPAIQAVKDRLRRVIVVSVMKGTPPRHQGQARRLKGLCDAQHDLYESDLKGRYKASEA